VQWDGALDHLAEATRAYLKAQRAVHASQLRETARKMADAERAALYAIRYKLREMVGMDVPFFSRELTSLLHYRRQPQD
jgi:hypothetical protein